jgi:hypothetical protein
VKGLKAKAMLDRKLAIGSIIEEVAGEAVSVRTARKFLLTMSVEALSGGPRLLDVHGEGRVLLIAFDDFLEVIADPQPTLAEVMATAKR